MHKYEPVTDPEHLDYFRSYIRRAFTAGGINTLLCFAYILFAPRATGPRYAAFAVLLGACIFVIMAVMIPVGINANKKLGYSYLSQPVLPYPLSFWYKAASLIPALPMMSMGMALGERGVTGLLSFFVVPIGMFSAMVIAFGAKGRVPAEPSCPHCVYPIDPETLPGLCPECAAKLNTINQLTRTPIVRRPWMIWSGTAGAAFAVLLFFSNIFGSGLIAAALPRPALLALAGSDDDAFGHLDTTTLTPAERDRIIESVLNNRGIVDNYKISDQLEWIAGLLASGSLTPEQAERLVFDDRQLQIIWRTISGNQREVSIRLDLPRARGVDPLMFCHTFPGDQFPAAVDPTELNHAGWRLSLPFNDRDRYRHEDDMPTAYRVPTITVPADQPFTAKARIVVFVAPPGTAVFGTGNCTITWHEDGTYTITPQPLVHKLFEAERAIPGP